MLYNSAPNTIAMIPDPNFAKLVSFLAVFIFRKKKLLYLHENRVHFCYQLNILCGIKKKIKSLAQF